MRRDACMCLSCLSIMSQPENRQIVTTNCQGCGKELLARAKPGYQYCSVCSTLEQRCLCCGEAPSTASEQLASQLIRKLLSIDEALIWSYEEAGEVLSFEMDQVAGQIYAHKNLSEETAIQLQLTPKLQSRRLNLCVYNKKVIDVTEAVRDVVFLTQNLDDILFLANRGCLYQSQFCGSNYEKWYWETYLALSKLH